MKCPRWRAFKRHTACLILAKKSCSSHLFGGGPKPGCSDGLRTGTIESRNFFCLRSYSGEISHPNSPNRGLSNDISDVVLRQRKVALHTSSHLTPIEAWRSAVSTTSEGRSVSSEVRLENCMEVWGWAKFGQCATPGWGKIALHTCSDLSKPVRTCLNQSPIQWQCMPVAVIFCTFGMVLFFSLTSYPAEIASFNSPNEELSNGLRVMVLYWSKIVDPSRSPCLKTIQRKSFEHRNFLVLRPVVLKIAYFNSDNR